MGEELFWIAFYFLIGLASSFVYLCVQKHTKQKELDPTEEGMTGMLLLFMWPFGAAFLIVMGLAYLLTFLVNLIYKKRRKS